MLPIKIKPKRHNNIPVIAELYYKANLSIPAMLEHKPIKILIKSHIGREPITILLDTGGTTSIINYHLLKRLDLLDHIDYRTVSSMKGFNGNETYSIGYLPYIELLFNNEMVPIAATVSELSLNNNDIDIILGLNFLVSYKAILDIDKKKLYINNLVIDIEII